MSGIADQLDAMDADALTSIGIAVIELLAGSLSTDETRQNSSSSTSVRAKLLQRERQTIEANLGESDLTLANVADAQGVSQRYLQKLFEPSKTNFNRFLRQRRLECCRDDLVDPRRSFDSISQICYRWGFSDLPNFSRSFREAYGISPRDYRQAMAAQHPKAPPAESRDGRQGTVVRAT